MELLEENIPCWKSIKAGKSGRISLFRNFNGRTEYLVVIETGRSVDVKKVYYNIEDVRENYGKEGWQK